MPAITKPNLHFDASLYTGTGSALSVTNGGFQPDLIWIKPRSIIGSHGLFDSVRGVSKSLRSHDTRVEDTSSSGNDLTAFNSNGFSVGTSSNIDTSTNGATVVAWQWKAGGAAVTNTSGTISSQVSANTTAGFSVVTASASGTSPVTIGHGLGVAPSMIIGRVRNNTASWYVYHSSMVASDYLVLNSTAAKATSSNIWDTTPTSTVFTVGNPQNGWNGTTVGSYNYVFYCFAPVAGYSAFGSYTGNGSTDGAFIFTNFRPRFVLIRSTSNLREWFIVDTARNSFNVANSPLRANVTSVEGTDTVLDMVSNGFKLRSSDTAFNGSGETYIYACFAENPFKYANAR
jgi:hypothetical protein